MTYPITATVTMLLAVVLVVGAVQAPASTAALLGAIGCALFYASLRLYGWRPRRRPR